ncbi:extracellular solute-binding protein [Streptomyces sp. HNM0574]|uniref:ABC transporter substrate-binding protein n=1 Tax=Streptomyces sp. HNM0574 TaxID=2714954 RepID=UPI00146A6384|nr:extracellular solute-binding protein [Streptomyces sp. HNM0574]NLU69986.1 extracellular solute-binding protein [Streptomyces sp. HNM0574]
MTLSRRSALRGAAVAGSALAGAGLAGCADVPGAARTTRQAPRRGDGPVRLVFWTWVPLHRAVKLWNRTREDIKVELQIIPANINGGYQKMHAALKSGNPPDLAQVEYYELPAFMLVQGLTDLSRYGAERLRDAYVPWQWEQGVFDGRVFTVPQASGPMAMFYRRDLLDRWDIPVPRTWGEFERAARTVKRRGGGARLTAFPPNQPQWFTALVWQHGARWITTEGDEWVVDLAHPAALEVAEFWERMVRDGLVSTMADQQSGWYRALQTGELVSWVGPQWGDALLRGNTPRTKGNWRVAPMPRWETGASGSGNWGGSSTAVLQGSRHPREALEFAHWLNTAPESIALLTEAGYGWPGARNAVEGTGLDRPDPFFGGQRYNEVFAASDRKVDTSWAWSPTQDQLFSHVIDAFGAAVSERGSLVEALRDCQGRAVDDLLAKGLRARSAR